MDSAIPWSLEIRVESFLPINVSVGVDVMESSSTRLHSGSTSTLHSDSLGLSGSPLDPRLCDLSRLAQFRVHFDGNEPTSSEVSSANLKMD